MKKLVSVVLACMLAVNVFAAGQVSEKSYFESAKEKVTTFYNDHQTAIKVGGIVVGVALLVFGAQLYNIWEFQHNQRLTHIFNDNTGRWEVLDRPRWRDLYKN